MWLWEDVSSALTYAATGTGSPFLRFLLPVVGKPAFARQSTGSLLARPNGRPEMRKSYDTGKGRRVFLNKENARHDLFCNSFGEWSG